MVFHIPSVAEMQITMKNDNKNDDNASSATSTDNNQLKPYAKASFTPASWSIRRLAPDSDARQRNIITTADGEKEICGIIESDADAKLIAAAPDLYDIVTFAAEEIDGILHDGLTLLDEMTEDQLNELLPVLCKALAKAREGANHE